MTLTAPAAPVIGGGQRPRAVVIGAGFGGLALAVRMQSAGFDVTLHEARDKPGGRAYVYVDEGYTFDAGPTVITDPACLEELFALSGRKMADYVTLLPVSPFYRLTWEDGVRFDYVNDQESLDRQIEAIEPADVEGYRRFLAYSKAVYAKGYRELGHVPFADFRSMLRVAPDLMKLESYRSVYSIVSKFIRNEKLRMVFSFHTLLVGGSPFNTSAIYALIHALEREGGVWFAKGGTGALIQGLVRLFEDLGGVMRLNSPVTKIVTAGDRVTGVEVGGAFEPAVAVASNADVVHTYDQLLREDASAQRTAKALKRQRYSMSLFVIHFGLRRPPTDLAHHTVIFGPRYRALIGEIFKGPALPEDFSLYLHSPCVTDPSLAPPGCSSYYVLSPVPHLGKADIDWSVEGPRYRDKILGYLEEHHIPGLKADLATCRIYTPEDFKGELNAHLGSAFSLEPVLWQSAYFRTHNRDKRIAGLYAVGAGTHPGAGVPGVVGSAKATARLVIADAGLPAQAEFAPGTLALPYVAPPEAFRPAAE